MIYYLFIGIASILTSGQFSTSKVFQKHFKSELKQSLLFCVFQGICAILLLFFIVISDFKITSYSIYMSLICSVLCISNTVISVKAFKEGPLVTFSFFMMLGTMLIPYIGGIVLLHESLSLLKIIGIIVLLLSLFLLSFNSKDNLKMSKKYYFYCFLIFISNGSLGLLSKIHQVSSNTSSPYIFSFFMCIFSVIISLIIYVIIKLSQKNKVSESSSLEEQNISKKKYLITMITISMVFTLFCQSSYILQLISASYLDASIIYPMLTGLNSVTNIIFARIIFKEPINKKTIIAGTIIIIGVLLFVI